jgi:hypothetical protein
VNAKLIDHSVKVWRTINPTLTELGPTHPCPSSGGDQYLPVVFKAPDPLLWRGGSPGWVSEHAKIKIFRLYQPYFSRKSHIYYKQRVPNFDIVSSFYILHSTFCLLQAVRE